MADLIAGAMSVQNLGSGAAGACRIQVFAGSQGNQWLVADFEVTGAQNTAISNVLNTSPATTTTVQFSAGPSALNGLYNAL